MKNKLTKNLSCAVLFLVGSTLILSSLLVFGLWPTLVLAAAFCFAYSHWAEQEKPE